MARTHIDTRPTLPDLSGRWSCLQVTTGEARVAKIGRVETVTRLISQLDIDQDGSALDVTWRVVDLQVDSGTRLARPSISRDVVQAMEVMRRSGHVGPGGEVVFPMASSTLGARLSHPDEELPSEASDPRVVDAESNGRPGATILFEGLLRGRVDVVQRTRTRLEGRVALPGRNQGLAPPAEVTGSVIWDVEQKVLGASNPLLRLAPCNRPVNEPDKSWFRMVRVAEEADPREVRRAVERSSDGNV